MTNQTVGIDLGTTFSSVAYVDERGQARVIPNMDGQKSTPSVVLIKDGRIEVGEIAQNQWVTDEEHVVRWIKRAMGQTEYRFQGLSAVEISAEILKVLKVDAEAGLGQPVREAVITCPAYFNSVEIEQTKKAGELAGLVVREVVKEPTAAAVYYGVENMTDGETILVCDLGGGTYDATILTYRDGTFIPLATRGDRELGGHDWTMILVELVAGRFMDITSEDPRNDLFAGQKLYEDCEKAKRDFARLEQINIPCQYQGRIELIPVSRDEFESATEYKIGIMIQQTEEAMTKAGLQWSAIDRILLVGGSSRLRRMAESLQKVSGKTPVMTGEPDLMVALGAAILARGRVKPRKMAGGLVNMPKGGLVDISFKRIIARSLGTRVVTFTDIGPVIRNSLIIGHGTESPVSSSRDDFEISFRGQLHFDLPVVEFEDEDDYDQISSYRFHCPSGAQRGDRIKVTFDYDESGIVSVSALDVKSGRTLVQESIPYEEPDPDTIVMVKAQPRWVVFAVDVSGSMGGEKMTNARQGVLDNARQLLAEGCDEIKVGIVSFNEHAQVVCRPTSDLRQVEQGVSTLSASGTTNMGDGLQFALDMIAAASSGTERDIVMLTDGMPDNRETALTMSGRVKSVGINLSAVGVGSQDVDAAFLCQLTPNQLIIDKVDGMGAAMTTLLTQAAEKRSGGLKNI